MKNSVKYVLLSVPVVSLVIAVLNTTDTSIRIIHVVYSIFIFLQGFFIMRNYESEQGKLMEEKNEMLNELQIKQRALEQYMSSDTEIKKIIKTYSQLDDYNLGFLAAAKQYFINNAPNHDAVLELLIESDEKLDFSVLPDKFSQSERLRGEKIGEVSNNIYEYLKSLV